MMSQVLLVSRSPVGSSSSSSCGWLARARAMVTRCCSPPESSPGRCSALSLSPTRFSRWCARAWRSFLVSLPRIVIGSSMFSKADIVARRLKVWKTKPTRERRRDESFLSLTFLPSIRSPKSSKVPAVHVSRHPIMFSSVVFPPPEGPRNMTNSPLLMGAISHPSHALMSLRATTGSSLFDST
mmetsp:Transcript_23298/g.56017  ORF Transcript_23298/g.56017 Transcript_23298/m.56017 type:complete len:183 (-) Transcript_23298:165-713(-)